MEVRLLSPEVALVSGIARIRGRSRAAGDRKAQEFSGTYRLLNIWQRPGGRWQLVAEAGTRLRER
jgi:ketosteroid isomerase-like protein